MTNCPTCGAPTVIVAMSTGTLPIDPEPNPNGTVEVRRSGLGMRGRYTGANTELAPGWVSKHTRHVCQEVKS